MLNLIPYPQSVKLFGGHEIISAMPDVVADDAFRTVADQLADLFVSLPRSTEPSVKLRIAVDTKISHPHGYHLEIAPGRILIAAATDEGAFLGSTTLRQLVEQSLHETSSISVPFLNIDDYPRFEWRGMMMDVSRHFFTADEVCKLLDAMALYKFNRFHWHLTDDQGWRFPVTKYPRLTQVGGVRRETLIGHERQRPRRYDGKPYGGSYSPDDIRRVVSHATKLRIEVIPEIDMPGHMQAAIAAYPHLGNLSGSIEVRTHWGISANILNPLPATLDFMKEVLAEVVQLFPGRFVHIGGDEAIKQEWSESKAAQNRMAELGLSGENDLQSWFITQMCEFLAIRGKRLLGWDEITEGGTPSGAVVVGWRGTSHAAKAAIAGHDVIMAPTSHTYFDNYQSDAKTEPLAIGGPLTLEKVYGFEPVPQDLPIDVRHRVLGGQAQLWSEYILSFEHLTYMAFPRGCALAETLWLEKSQMNYGDFARRMASQKDALQARIGRIGPIAESK